MHLYFVAIGIEEDKRVPMLLSSIAAQTHLILRDLVAPDVPGTLPFGQIFGSTDFKFPAKTLGESGKISLP